jgi:hypothetical protein
MGKLTPQARRTSFSEFRALGERTESGCAAPGLLSPEKILGLSYGPKSGVSAEVTIKIH